MIQTVMNFKNSIVAFLIVTLVAGFAHANVSVEIYSRDEGLGDYNMSKPRIYIKNTGTEAITDFYYRYYFETENGKAPMLAEYYTPDENVMLIPYGSGYYIQYNVNGINLTPDGLHPDGSGNVVGLHYNDWTAWDKTNDYSNTQSASFSQNQNITLYVNNTLVYGTEPGGVAGSVLREVWTGISGITIADIPLGTDPDVVGSMSSLDAPKYTDDNYGARMSGYITAPVSGDYTFFIASDDYSEFYLSSDDDPVNKGTAITSVSGWTQPYEWNKYSSQQSAPQTLVAGNRYYIEILHKEGAQGDHCEVGWLKPGESGTPLVVPGTVLTPYVPEVIPETPILSVTNVTSNTITLSWTNVANELGYIIQMASRGGGFSHLTSLLGDISSYTVNSLEEQVSYHFKIKAYNSFGESDPSNAALATTFASTAGKISREVWTGVYGNLVANIPTGTTPSFTDEITSLETQQQWMDYYGQRIRGYIVPPTTGDYTFFIASDDNSNLWLSTDNDPENKALIAWVSGYTDYHAYTKYSTQKSVAISLTAGVPYYIEILHKDGNQNDNLSVGWCKPGDGTGWPFEVIPATYLSPYVVPTLPDAPDGLAATPLSATQIDVTWNDNSSNESGFTIERSVGGESFVVVGNCAMNVTTFHDGGLSENTQYTYRVSAWNGVGSAVSASTVDAITFSQAIQITPDVELLSFAVYSSENTTIKDHSYFNGGGAVGSNGMVEIFPEAIINGNAISGGNIVLHPQATVVGDATAAGTVTLESSAVVTGEVTSGGTVPSLTIPEKTITIGTEDITVEQGQNVTKTPGIYNDVLVKTGGTLTLSAGQYSFASLFLQPEAHIKLDVGSIAVLDVDIQGNCEFSDRSTVTFVSVEGGYIPFIRFYTNDNDNIRIGCEVILNGTFTAPHGTINMYSRAQCKGALYGKNITIEPDAIINSEMNDPNGDYDGDHIHNIIEVVMGTDPYSDTSYIPIAIPSVGFIDNSQDVTITYDYSIYFPDYAFATAMEATFPAGALQVAYIPLLPIVKNFPESNLLFDEEGYEVTGRYLGFHSANELVGGNRITVELPIKVSATTTHFEPKQDNGSGIYAAPAQLGDQDEDSQEAELDSDKEIIFVGKRKNGGKTVYMDGYVFSSNLQAVCGAMLAIKQSDPDINKMILTIEYDDYSTSPATPGTPFTQELFLDDDIFRMNRKFIADNMIKITKVKFEMKDGSTTVGSYEAAVPEYPLRPGQTAYIVAQHSDRNSRTTDDFDGSTDAGLLDFSYLAGDVTFESAPFSEGRIIRSSGSGGVESFDYDYFLTDHLGSTRMAVRKGASDKAEIVEATMYSPYGIMKPVKNNAGLDVRGKFTTKEFDEEGESIGRMLVDMGFAFDPAELNLDPTKHNAIGLFYTEESLAAEDQVGDVFYCEIDDVANTARAKGSVHCSIAKEVKWIHVLLGYVDDDGNGNPAFDVNCKIENIDETIGPGSKVEISQDFSGKTSLPSTLTKSAIDIDRDDAYYTGGINAYYFGARYYDPETGVWLSTDPAGQGWNAYGYCNNNPIIIVDPDGKIWIIVGAMLMGAWLGGASQNNWNPAFWQWENDADTWRGVIIGGVAGGLLGAGAYFGGWYEMSINFQYLSNFGSSVGIKLTQIGEAINFTAWGTYASVGSLGAATIFGAYSIYNYGQGTSGFDGGKYQQDFTWGYQLTLGSESSMGIPQYTLNYNTPGGYNYYKNSFTYGQFHNYNTATGDITRQGMIGFRLGGHVSAYTHNDVKYLGGGDTDQGWTGGGGISIIDRQGNIHEVMNDCFTGIAPREIDNKNNYNIGADGHTYWRQSIYNQTLNKAYTFARNNHGVRTINTSGWSQNIIHDHPWINTHRFKYQNWK